MPRLLSPVQIVLINAAIFFGHYVIVSLALNFQFGNAGIPNMSSNVSVAMGAYTVSALVIRACMWVVGQAGQSFRPDWVYDNPYNTRLITVFFQERPFLSLGAFLLSLALSFLVGSAAGWLIGALSSRLRATRLMILLFIVSDAVSNVAANNEGIAGGTLGAFVPNFFAWYQGEQMAILALAMLSVGLACFFVTRAMMNSPFGRLMRALRENEVTLESTGKNVAEVRRHVMMFGSGMMALSGVLLSYYYSFVQHTMYDRVSYTFWPWLMITVGGLGNNAGAYVGTLLCVSILKGLNLSKQGLGPLLISTQWIKVIGYLENLMLGALFLVFLMFRPQGLIPEKSMMIRGVNYVKILWGGDEPRRS